MNPEYKAKWIAALRSGKYPQCKGKLKNEYDDSYCGLGVLQEISGIHPRDWTRGVLTRECARAVGLPYVSIADDRPSQLQNILMDMNDRGASFSEIADYIEANL